MDRTWCYIVSHIILIGHYLIAASHQTEIGKPLNDTEELIFIHSVLMQHGDLPNTQISVDSAISLPASYGLRFAKVPVRNDLRQERFALLWRKYGPDMDSLLSARNSLLSLCVRQYEKMIENSSFKIAHNSYLVKKLGGIEHCVIQLKSLLDIMAARS